MKPYQKMIAKINHLHITHTITGLSKLVFTLAAALLCLGCDPKQDAPATTQDPGSPGSDSATISASPNPVPIVGELGKTTIKWKIEGSEEGEVWVLSEGASEAAFATGGQGAVEVPWIKPGMTYEFRLYESPNRKKLLKSLKVVGENPARNPAPVATQKAEGAEKPETTEKAPASDKPEVK